MRSARALAADSSKMNCPRAKRSRGTTGAAPKEFANRSHEVQQVCRAASSIESECVLVWRSWRRSNGSIAAILARASTMFSDAAPSHLHLGARAASQLEETYDCPLTLFGATVDSIILTTRVRFVFVSESMLDSGPSRKLQGFDNNSPSISADARGPAFLGYREC